MVERRKGNSNMASNSKTALSEGASIDIRLGGKEYFMYPNLNAALTISRTGGGIRGAIDAVTRMDVDTVITVVRLGLGKEAKEFGDDLPELIWRAGMTDARGQLCAKCIEYLTLLANGGEPLNTPRKKSEDIVEGEVKH